MNLTRPPTISIVVPTYGRADRLADVSANIHATTITPHEVVFAIEAEDEASQAAVPEGDRVFVNTRARSYAGAMNTAYRQGLADLVFAGSDDLRFHPGWDIPAVRLLDEQVQVVGTNDLLNPYVAKGWHATHYLIDRRYLDHEGGVVDEGAGSFLFEGYDHQFTDTEFIGTAKARARFRPCLDSVVEHMHVLAGKATADAGHERAYAREAEDGEVYEKRKALWWDLSR